MASKIKVGLLLIIIASMVGIGILHLQIIYAEAQHVKSLKESHINYKEEMITFIKEINLYSKDKNSSFEVIGNNALGLLKPADIQNHTLGQLSDSLDGMMLESLFYGWEMSDGQEITVTHAKAIEEPVTALINHDWPVFNIDYCNKTQDVDRSYQLNSEQGIVSIAAERLLDTIPSYPLSIHNENNNNIYKLKQGKNILVLLNPHKFADKETYLRRLQNTNYDVVIIDRDFDGSPLSVDDVTSLKSKKNGGSRLVFAYMSIGEAEDYRAYWQPSWTKILPNWIVESNPEWAGSYKVKYWDKNWKKIIFGEKKSNLDMILASGFNGAFLDVVDAYHYFEE